MLSWVSLRFESFDITRSVEYEDIREKAAMLRVMTPDLIVDEKGPCSSAKFVSDRRLNFCTWIELLTVNEVLLKLRTQDITVTASVFAWQKRSMTVKRQTANALGSHFRLSTMITKLIRMR
jgi:hypothetical protein